MIYVTKFTFVLLSFLLKTTMSFILNTSIIITNNKFYKYLRFQNGVVDYACWTNPQYINDTDDSTYGYINTNVFDASANGGYRLYNLETVGIEWNKIQKIEIVHKIKHYDYTLEHKVMSNPLLLSFLEIVETKGCRFSFVVTGFIEHKKSMLMPTIDT